MVDRLRFGRCCQPTLTVEPGFTSSGHMEQLLSDQLLSIGALARRAGVATSTVRYYERLGLLHPDGRESGQRRYRPATLRRLVFIGMLKDAGLSLDDIDGIVNAASNDEWKGIARRRLRSLEEQIAQFEEADTLDDEALEIARRFDRATGGGFFQDHQPEHEPDRR